MVNGKFAASCALGLAAALSILPSCHTSMTVSENRMKVLLARAVGEGGGYPPLESQIFGPKTIFTGVMRPERFERVLGFWFFLDGPHRPGAIPVVLVHGHSSGPRPFANLAAALDRDAFEPWFTFYPTGNRIERSASLLRAGLAATAERFGVEEVALVAYSMGGLVGRQALRPAADGVDLPRVRLFVGVANPWGGSEESKFESERSFAPPGWEDVSDGSPFLAHLFDDPLPEGAEFHYVYGLGGKPDGKIGEVNDGILSGASLTRKEMLAEAKSVTLFEDADHGGIVRDRRTVDGIVRLLRARFGR